jgi:hypothetical protein
LLFDLGEYELAKMAAEKSLSLSAGHATMDALISACKAQMAGMVASLVTCSNGVVTMCCTAGASSRMVQFGLGESAARKPDTKNIEKRKALPVVPPSSLSPEDLAEMVCLLEIPRIIRCVCVYWVLW